MLIFIAEKGSSLIIELFPSKADPGEVLFIFPLCRWLYMFFRSSLQLHNNTVHINGTEGALDVSAKRSLLGILVGTQSDHQTH